MKNRNEQHAPSEARIRANRENAKKSTGPCTPEGKAASSRNHLVHGLRANKHILLDEDPEEFLILLKDLHDRFRPVGDGEEELVLRIASAQWRLHRTLPMEAGIYRERLQAVAAEDYSRKRELVNQKRNHELNPERVPPAPAPPDAGDRLTRAFEVDCARRNSLANLARYETSIERSIDRCLRQLQAYQASRIAATPEAGEARNRPSRGGGGRPIRPNPLRNAHKNGNYHSNPNDTGRRSTAASPSPIPNPSSPAAASSAERPLASRKK